MNSKEEHWLVVDLVIIRQRQHMSGAAECEGRQRPTCTDTKVKWLVSQELVFDTFDDFKPVKI